MKAVRLLIPAFALMTALAPMAHAQFGSGIVYDPTQSAHAVQEIQQGEQQLQKWATELNNWQQHLLKEAQIFTTAEQTRTQIVTMYNLAYQMATMPQNLEARYKADWSQWQSLAAPPNAYGNTSPLVNALNFGGLPQAQQGDNSAYVQPQSYPSGSYSSLDSRTQATVANQYATSELAQSTTTSIRQRAARVNQPRARRRARKAAAAVVRPARSSIASVEGSGTASDKLMF